mgnify:FL=1
MNPQPYRYMRTDGFFAIPVDGSHLKRKLKEDGKHHAMKKDFIVYGQEQRDIVEAGISAVAAVLLEGSEESKRSLLFCLDYYLDPYYGCLHPDSDGIFILLQQCLLTEPSSEVRADIMQLLSDYCDCPLDVLRRHLPDIPKECREDVLRLLAEP